jgi:hypothetical protein
MVNKQPIQQLRKHTMLQIGDRGRAVTDLRPTGYIECDGRRLSAKADRLECLASGEEVVVVGGDAFGVVVRSANSVGDVRVLPNHGDAVPTTLDEIAERRQHEIANDDEPLVMFGTSFWTICTILAAIGAGIGFYFSSELGLIIGIIIGMAIMPSFILMMNALNDGAP